MCEDHLLLLNNRSTLNCVVTQNRTNDEFDAKQFDQKYRAESYTHKFRGNLETLIQCCWPRRPPRTALSCAVRLDMCDAYIYIKGIKTGDPRHINKDREGKIYIFIYYAVLMIWRMLWRSRSSSSSKHNCEICHAQKMVADIWNVCCV